MRFFCAFGQCCAVLLIMRINRPRIGILTEYFLTFSLLEPKTTLLKPTQKFQLANWATQQYDKTIHF